MSHRTGVNFFFKIDVTLKNLLRNQKNFEQNIISLTLSVSECRKLRKMNLCLAQCKLRNLDLNHNNKVKT